MNQHTINELLDVLEPVLKSRTRAKEILTTEILVLVWSPAHVYRAANERGLALTHAEALDVLSHFRLNYNAQYGIRWSDITDFVEDQVLGRKLTPRELHRFIHKDIITIQKS